MREDAVYETLQVIFADVFMRDDIDLDPSLTARDVAGWDSLKHVEIIMVAEQRFGIRFKSAEVDQFNSLGDLVKIITQRADPAS